MIPGKKLDLLKGMKNSRNGKYIGKHKIIFLNF